MLMEIYVRDIHSDMIKPSYNGGLDNVVDLVTHKSLIFDITLRSFIPPQVHNITPKLCQICGCDRFIITNYMHIDLNIFRIKPVTDLQ